MKYFLGVDIALRKTGLVLIDEKGDLVYDYLMNIPVKLQYTEAMAKIYETMTEVYTFIETKFQPDHLTTVMEDVAGFVHIKSALAIHAARTSAVLAYHHSHTPHKEIVYYTPNVVKHWLTGKRAGKKEELLAGLQARYPQYRYDALGEDERDALALVLYHTKGVK